MILVAGGTGTLGTLLVRALTASGESVHAARMQGAAGTFGGYEEAEELAATLRSDTEAVLVAALGDQGYRSKRAAGALLSLGQAAAEARTGTAPVD